MTREFDESLYEIEWAQRTPDILAITGDGFTCFVSRFSCFKILYSGRQLDIFRKSDCTFLDWKVLTSQRVKRNWEVTQLCRSFSSEFKTVLPSLASHTARAAASRRLLRWQRQQRRGRLRRRQGGWLRRRGRRRWRLPGPFKRMGGQPLPRNTRLHALEMAWGGAGAMNWINNVERPKLMSWLIQNCNSTGQWPTWYIPGIYLVFIWYLVMVYTYATVISQLYEICLYIPGSC